MKYPIEVEEKRKINRITLKQSVLDLLNAFNIERGLIYTLKLLFVNPDKIVIFYLGEGRFRIFNVFRLLILTTAVSLFVMYLAGVDDLLLEFEKGFNKGLTEKEEGQIGYLSGLMQQLFFDWYNLFLWIAIPIYGFFTFLFFPKKGYNYAEHLVIQSFYICALNVIAIVTFPLHLVIGVNGMVNVWGILSTAYFFYLIIRVFSVKNFGSVVKSLLLFIVNTLVYISVLVLAIGIFVGYELETARMDKLSSETLALADSSWISDRVVKSKERLITNAAGKKIWESIETHGGLEKWFSNGPIAFRFNYQPLDGTKQRDSYQLVDNWSVRAAHEVSSNRNWKYGWDGENAWSLPDSVDVGVNPRFWSTTPYYFIGLPFVLADEGVVLEEFGQKEYKGVTYDLVKATYEAGTGDASDDFYVIYLDPETRQMAGLRYIVSYPGFFPAGGHSPEKFMWIQDYQEVEGIQMSTGYNTYWFKGDSVAEHITKIEVSNVEFLPETLSSYFDVPVKAKVQEGF
ncbi:hypothetical protein [Ekhidna sp.]